VRVTATALGSRDIQDFRRRPIDRRVSRKKNACRSIGDRPRFIARL